MASLVSELVLLGSEVTLTTADKTSHNGFHNAKPKTIKYIGKQLSIAAGQSLVNQKIITTLHSYTAEV
jgi:hypothetical protein